MILTYNDCKNKYGSQYNINKAIKNGELYQLEKGIYSDKSYEPELQIISTKYPNAVFTMNSAFYYHNLTDTIPEKYHLATSKSSAAISDKRVIQRYENSATLELGVIIKEIEPEYLKDLKEIDPLNMSPMEALNYLVDLKNRIK